MIITIEMVIIKGLKSNFLSQITVKLFVCGRAKALSYRLGIQPQYAV
ncbi:MAG: hypothetical protein MGU50_10240 [Trichodesmium sp. MAG_R02]|jgi:hypothetical protein|nr:hypothetical protein [Trichodesmium sp. MAG_R02]